MKAELKAYSDGYQRYPSMLLASFKSINECFCAGYPLVYQHVLLQLGIFFSKNLLKPVMYHCCEEKRTAGCGPYMPLPWCLLSLNQLTFPLNYRNQCCFEKGNVYWKFRRLIST